ncbi:hypothetical protein GUITHDRAFT_160701 [Guillardia theta CCMP2712]|uniref:Pentacotripeptide-repeat region of PRORP domain-containing protein n=1 Tax=Guillardia theta (strain CCMP2712) TaxID=905079 RepID=L1K1R9_GUITC|nr:hypothetical protein GUITHDRAFT_160701 [Guillardia theta CCMP2712]EKX54562.1 hypothetical protein GUITHDRAFT_160701 [Guillardia theta CCMP2712]|eukprot:XP_005841542.1 hypothetical protein GUITHDRAFT_160701 [Guillardia theta CCMP2712]
MSLISRGSMQNLLLILALGNLLVTCDPARGTRNVHLRLELRGGEKRSFVPEAFKNKTERSKRFRSKAKHEHINENADNLSDKQKAGPFNAVRDDYNISADESQGSSLDLSVSSTEESDPKERELSESAELCPACGNLEHENLTSDVDMVIPTDLSMFPMDEETKKVFLARERQNLTVDAELCEFLMKLCCKRENCTAALGLFQFMENQSMAPTYMTIGYLLNLLTEEKQFPLGVSVLQKSLKMGFSLNDEVYDMEWSILIELFEEMRSSGFIPNDESYISFFEACSHMHEGKKALQEATLLQKELTYMNDQRVKMEERLLQLREMKEQEEKRDNSERSSMTVSVETELKKMGVEVSSSEGESGNSNSTEVEIG